MKFVTQVFMKPKFNIVVIEGKTGQHFSPGTWRLYGLLKKVFRRK